MEEKASGDAPIYLNHMQLLHGCTTSAFSTVNHGMQGDRRGPAGISRGSTRGGGHGQLPALAYTIQIL